MRLSAMEHISTSGSGVPRTIGASGVSLESVHSGLLSVTGCSLSTSEVTTALLVRPVFKHKAICLSQPLAYSIPFPA